MALKVLAAGWKEDPDTLPIVKQATQERDFFLPGVAVEALAAGWKEDPDTLPIVKQATQNGNGVVRQTAVEALAAGWKEDPDTLPIVKQASQDEHEYVRQIAVEAIAMGWWKDEPGIFELLSQIARTDAFVREYDFQDNPRKVALETILKNYPDRPEILQLLRDRSANDTDETLRQFAQKKLAEWEGG